MFSNATLGPLEYTCKEERSSFVVVQANSLIEASYSLSLEEKRIIVAAISKIDPRKNVPKEINISGNEYASMFNLNPKSAYKQLSDGCSKLFTRRIVVLNRDTNKKENYHWLQSYKEDIEIYKSGYGASIRFSDDIMPYLGNLKSNFTSYKLNHIKNLNSPHAIRIFELCSQFDKKGRRFITIDSVREFLNLKDKYPRYADLKRFVLIPSLAEIDTKTPYSITYKEERKGRKVHKIWISYELKG
jgi:plasmid replication initiation protein